MNFNLRHVRVNRLLVKYACNAKISDFIESLELDMVLFASIWVSYPFSGEPISNVGLSIHMGHSIRVSNLGSIFSGLLASRYNFFWGGEGEI